MIELHHNDPIDCEPLKALYQDNDDLQKAWPGAKHPLCVEEWVSFLGSPSESASLLFKISNTFIGHLVLKLKEGRELYVCFVVLDKSFRGKGHIYEMLKLAERFAHHYFGSQVLWLNVDPSNTPAIRAYEKLGYQFVRVTEAGRNRMKKQLNLKFRTS